MFKTRKVDDDVESWARRIHSVALQLLTSGSKEVSLSLDLNDEIEGASSISFGRDFQIRGPADRKP